MTGAEYWPFLQLRCLEGTDDVMTVEVWTLVKILLENRVRLLTREWLPHMNLPGDSRRHVQWAQVQGGFMDRFPFDDNTNRLRLKLAHRPNALVRVEIARSWRHSALKPTKSPDSPSPVERRPPAEQPPSQSELHAPRRRPHHWAGHRGSPDSENPVTLGHILASRCRLPRGVSVLLY